MTQSPQITMQNWIMVAILGVTWGATFFVTEIALEGITPFWLAAGRISFASLLMLAIWHARGAPLFVAPVSNATRLSMLAMGALSSAVPFMLLAWGQQFVTGGFAGVSMAAVALMVLPLAHFFVPGEQLNWRKVIGFIIGFCGVLVLIGARAFESTGAEQELAGRLACLSAAMCYGISTILMRRLPAVDPIGLSTVLIVISAFIVIPVAFYAEGPPPLPDGKTIGVVLILGLIPTAAANFLRTLIVRSAGPVFMSLTNYQVPVWSVVFGAVLLNEPLPASLLWALILILCGVAFAQYGALRRLFGKRHRPH